MNKEEIFLQNHLSKCKNEFWKEIPFSTILKFIEMSYDREVLRHWFVGDLVLNSSVLVKWEKRHTPLTDLQLKEKFGK